MVYNEDMTTTQTSGILHPIADLNKPGGIVHLATVSRNGFSTYCVGRHMAWGIGTPAEVTCKACLAKATKNGIEVVR
jgi:hypothetical protein